MHKCLTYFLIYSKKMINMENIIKELDLNGEVVSGMTDQTLEIGRCEEYDVDINNMVRKSINSLVGKESILLSLKEKYNLELYLSKVVMLDTKSDEPTPILSLDADIVEFLYKTSVVDDIDYYLY